MRGALAVLAFIVCSTALAAPKAPPNVVVIDEKLTTSGQPSAEWLRTLKAQGYEAVIYLAPATVSDAVREEPQIVTGQGLAWQHIPIPFGAPTAAHYAEFARVLQAQRGKKVLVHCQVNMRASTLTFLYRVVVEKVPPEQAWSSVTRVWVPGDAWKTLMLSELRKNGFHFDPF